MIHSSKHDRLISGGISVDGTTVTGDGSPGNPLISTGGAGGVSDGDKGDIVVSGSGTVWTLEANIRTRAVTFAVDGGGSTITTGIKSDIYIPYACTITSVTMLADQSGSCVVDIWKDSYANYPPTIADTITASAKPTITTATKSQDSTLTGWITSISAGDSLRFNVDSVTSITRLVLVLKVTV